VPEQEYLPPRPPARFHRPDGPDGYPEEEPPPWANLPPVRPSRPAADHAVGSWPDTDPPPPPGSREQVPAWVGPDAVPIGEAEDDAPRESPDGWAGRPAARGPDERPGRSAARRPGGRVGRPAEGGRALRAAARRRRRWLIIIAGLVIMAGGVIAAVLVPDGSAPAPVVPGGLITTFQPGELQTVPDACGTVPAATVQQYLPGKVKQASPLPIDGSAESACDWTVDQPPVYRLLELDLLAYAPSGLASGDGSATYAAIDAYAQSLQDLQDPPRHSADPRAAITTLSGLGNEAFSATQVFRRGGAVTDVATVVVRYHNVIVTATLNGLDHSNRGTYGPVSLSELSSAALAFAQAAEAALH
jgi:hypothetical protein